MPAGPDPEPTRESRPAGLANRRVPLLAWAAQARGWFAEAESSTGPFASARNERLRRLAADIGQPGMWPIVGPANDAELDDSLRAETLRLTAASGPS